MAKTMWAVARDAGGFAGVPDRVPDRLPTSTGEHPSGCASGGHVAVILVTRKRSHPATIAYIERRVQEGKTRREANRCLKRYLARSLYRLLEHDATGDLTDIEASLAQAKSYGVQPARLPPLRRRRANTAQAATSKASRTLQTVSGNGEATT